MDSKEPMRVAQDHVLEELSGCEWLPGALMCPELPMEALGALGALGAPVGGWKAEWVQRHKGDQDSKSQQGKVDSGLFENVLKRQKCGSDSYNGKR